MGDASSIKNTNAIGESNIETSTSRREQLHAMLEGALGSPNVYYQPPINIEMKFPAIRYSLKSIDKMTANNVAYKLTRAYEIIVISKSPDCAAIEKILEWQHTRYDRHYVADNLHHDVITIYY